MQAMHFRLNLSRKQQMTSLMLLIGAFAAGLLFSAPSHALDLVAFTGITGPLVSALTQLGTMTPSIKAVVGIITFVVALISLSALRSFGAVLFYIGVAIFASVGLVVSGAIMGYVI